jgi:hypothetical protein
MRQTNENGLNAMVQNADIGAVIARHRLNLPNSPHAESRLRARYINKRAPSLSCSYIPTHILCAVIASCVFRLTSGSARRFLAFVPNSSRTGPMPKTSDPIMPRLKINATPITVYCHHPRHQKSGDIDNRNKFNSHCLQDDARFMTTQTTYRTKRLSNSPDNA